MRRTITIVLICLLVTCPAFGANKYIRQGASGTGSGDNWTDAYASFAAASSAGYTRGNVYYIAGGTYNENVSVSVPYSGTSTITFKKANAFDNSGVTGWNASYATDQAVINGQWSFVYGRYILDGVTGSGTSGHGIKVKSSNTSGVVLHLDGSEPSFYINGVDVEGPGFASSATCSHGIYNNNVATPQKGLIISNTWVHEVTCNGLTLLGLVGTDYVTDPGFVLSGIVISETGGATDPDNHGQAIQFGPGTSQKYGVIKNSQFHNTTGTGVLAFLGKTINDHILIYNNVFSVSDGQTATYSSSPSPIYFRPLDSWEAEKAYSLDAYRAPATPDGHWYKVTKAGTSGSSAPSWNTTHASVTSDGTVEWTNQGAITDYHLASNIGIYNNTFYNISLMQMVCDMQDTCTDYNFKNNLVINGHWTSADRPVPPLVKSNNAYYGSTGTGYPTVDTDQQNETSLPIVSGTDFHLVAGAKSIGNGLDLSSIFTSDIAGNTRTSWDIGAYWSGTEGEPPTVTGNIGGGTFGGMVVK